MKNYSSLLDIDGLGRYWIKSLKNIYPENLFGKAKLIKGLIIEGQKIDADVKGANAEVYRVSITVEKTTENIKQKIKDIISAHPSIASDISLGCFSELFMELIIEEASDIFPQNSDDVKISCACGEEVICSHISAVYESLEKKINKNPFLILNLRGISTVALIEAAGMKNDYMVKLSKNIHNKFIPATEIVVDKNENGIDKDFSDISFPKTDPESLFFLLPNTPLFFERKNFKLKLLNVYETVETELESILISKKMPPPRNTEFYIYYSDDNSLKAFVNPVGNFLNYLKSKGSRLRFNTSSLNVPVFCENEQNLIVQEKEGLSIESDYVFEYFLYRSQISGNEELTPSARFLNVTASLAIALTKSLSFVPEAVMNSSKDFYIRYVPLCNNDEITEALDYHKSVMPANFMFKENSGNVLAQDASYDVLSIFLTYLIHKITFLRASKFENDNITGLFTKPEPRDAINPEGKNFALSISNWLEVISRKEQKISLVLRIEPYKNSDDFALHIDIANSENSETMPLYRIFEEEEQIFSTPIDQVKFDIIRQIMIASDYLQVLKNILDTKGLEIAVINLKETLEIISTASVFLNALDMKIVIPKELKKVDFSAAFIKSKIEKNKQLRC